MNRCKNGCSVIVCPHSLKQYCSIRYASELLDQHFSVPWHVMSFVLSSLPLVSTFVIVTSCSLSNFIVLGCLLRLLALLTASILSTESTSAYSVYLSLNNGCNSDSFAHFTNRSSVPLGLHAKLKKCHFHACWMSWNCYFTALYFCAIRLIGSSLAQDHAKTALLVSQCFFVKEKKCMQVMFLAAFHTSPLWCCICWRAILILWLLLMQHIVFGSVYFVFEVGWLITLTSLLGSHSRWCLSLRLCCNIRLQCYFAYWDFIAVCNVLIVLL